jgi:hypothetical protein
MQVKESIVGYITAMINTYDKKTAPGLPLVERQLNQGFVDELSYLLDFVEDIPEEKEPITIVIDGGVK